jgi:hypothetical protein
MVSAERALTFHVPQAKAGYFKSSALVLTDTLANRVYGMDSKTIAVPADKAREAHPRLARALEVSAKYAFWIGTAYLGAEISHHTGPALGYTAAYAHPFIVGAAVKAAKSDLPSLEIRKPGLGTFLASFGLVELASTPLFISVMDKVSHMFSTLSPIAAGISVAAANAIAVTLEYLGFRLLWKNIVLRGMDGGGFKDELKGFVKEFNPLKLFSSSKSGGQASSAGEYIGQIWGVVESLWLWVQVAGIATAAAIAHLHLATHDNLIDMFFQKSALWGKKFLEVFALSRCCILIESKIRENEKRPDVNNPGK